MTNTSEFKVVLLRKGWTAEKLADSIGMSCQSLSYKINNKREFTSSEIANIQKTLGLSSEERDKIFFTEMVENISTN